MAPSGNVYLRNSFDTDPSGYLGRFLPAGLQDLDESNGMTMACSEHISWKFVDGGGVKMTEVLNVSSAASARLGVPLIAKGKGSVSSSQVARVSYTLTGKMVSTIDDPGAFAFFVDERLHEIVFEFRPRLDLGPMTESRFRVDAQTPLVLKHRREFEFEASGIPAIACLCFFARQVRETRGGAFVVFACEGLK